MFSKNVSYPVRLYDPYRILSKIEFWPFLLLDFGQFEYTQKSQSVDNHLIYLLDHLIWYSFWKYTISSA